MSRSRNCLLGAVLLILSCTFDAAAQNACSALPPATAPDFETKLEHFIATKCYIERGWMHDANVRSSGGVHPFIKIYYSPQLWHWLTVNRRQGNPPDGSVLVKEQYPDTKGKLDSWTIMVKDAKGSHDGWYWADLEAPSSSLSWRGTRLTGLFAVSHAPERPSK